MTITYAEISVIELVLKRSRIALHELAENPSFKRQYNHIQDLCDRFDNNEINAFTAGQYRELQDALRNCIRGLVSIPQAIPYDLLIIMAQQNVALLDAWGNLG